MKRITFMLAAMATYTLLTQGCSEGAEEIMAGESPGTPGASGPLPMVNRGPGQSDGR